MKKTKSIRLLDSLDEAEKADLSHFLHAPYFNTDPEIPRLYEVLTVNWPKYPTTKEDVYYGVRPDQPYDDKAFRYLTSQLNKLIERFLAIRAYEQQPPKPDLDLLRAFAERHLEKEYQQTLRRLQHTMEQWPGRDASYFHHQLQVATVHVLHSHRRPVARLRAADPGR